MKIVANASILWIKTKIIAHFLASILDRSIFADVVDDQKRTF